jgi:hypothetical protein
VKYQLVPQIQKTRRLPVPEKKSAGFLNLWEITILDDDEYKCSSILFVIANVKAIAWLLGLQ